MTQKSEYLQGVLVNRDHPLIQELEREPCKECSSWSAQATKGAQETDNG